MKFYNRKEELELLEKAVKRAPSLIIVRGRRRVGKTSLILKVLKEHNGIYFYVDGKKNEKELLREFEGILKKEFSLPEYVKIEKWEALYEIIFANERIVAFDEFQRLLDVNPSAISQLQDYWDRKGIHSKARIILSGSNVGMIKKIFIEEGAPLFKRATFELILKPFSFEASRELLAGIGIEKIEEQIKAYSLIGGIPYYYALLEGDKLSSFEEAARALVLNRLSPLKNEARETVAESFGKEHPNYYAVVNAIALGKTTKKEIADFAGIKEASIYPYLYDLEELTDIIEYQVPITEKKPWRSRQGRFVIKDNFFRFWFTYVFRNMSYYEEGNYGEIEDEISKTIEGFVGKCFEKVAGEFLAKLNGKGKLPEKFKKIGSWWNRKGEDIDLVLESDEAIILVECKWDRRTDAKEVLGELARKEKLVQHGKKRVYYGIVARGFEAKIKGAVCFDIGDVDIALSR